MDSDGWAHTDLDIGALVVGNARVGCALRKVSRPLWGNIRTASVRTKIDANGTLVDFVAHIGYILQERPEKLLGERSGGGRWEAVGAFHTRL